MKQLQASGEDYLEAILVLRKQIGMVRSVDLARYMGYSKPSISHAVTILRNEGFLLVDDEGFLILTEAGLEIAERIYEKHCFFTDLLVGAGVAPETAEKDACKIEHVISMESYQRLKDRLNGQETSRWEAEDR